MSTDYEIKCACGGRFSRDNWRNPREVALLLTMRSEFAAIHKKAGNLWMYGWDAHESMFPGAFEFFAQHEGHEMTVFDEYGRAWTEEYNRRRNELYAEMQAPGCDATLLRAQLDDLNREMEEP